MEKLASLITERVRLTLVIGRAGAESESASESEELEEVAWMTGTALRIGGEFSSSSSVTVEDPGESSTLVICCGAPGKKILKSFKISLLSDLMQVRRRQSQSLKQAQVLRVSRCQPLIQSLTLMPLALPASPPLRRLILSRIQGCCGSCLVRPELPF